jgi:HD-GYP domain-containing protein (c-di-GMP phosphodiesterase class II)
MDDGGDLRLSEIVAALSYALDITDGQPAGHAVRTCLIGMRLGDEVGLEVDDRAALFYALLLKDAGCASNAAKVSAPTAPTTSRRSAR